jgi:hypothetical protein
MNGSHSPWTSSRDPVPIFRSVSWSDRFFTAFSDGSLEQIGDLSVRLAGHGWKNVGRQRFSQRRI